MYHRSNVAGIHCSDGRIDCRRNIGEGRLAGMFELQWEDHSSRLSEGPTIALIPAGGALWDDFLDSIGFSLEKFCSEGPGGWQRGYINGFLLCGLRTVLIFFSA